MDPSLSSVQDAGQGQTVTAALAAALDSGQLDAGDFNAAVDRVGALRNGFTATRYFPETG